MIRLIKLGFSLVILLVLLVVADRLGAKVAGQVVANQIKSNQNLTTTPKVTIAGVPFLPQLARGKYDEVDVAVVNYPLGQVDATSLKLELFGVQLKAKDVVTRSVTVIPVDRGTGTVLLSYAEINRWGKPHGITVKPGNNGDVAVTGSVTVAGHTFSATGVGAVKVVPGGIQVTVGEIQAEGLSTAVSALLGNRLTFVVPTTGLPYGLQLTSVQVTRVGIVADATVGAFSIPVHD